MTKLAMYAVDVNDMGPEDDITMFDDEPFDEVGAGESIFFLHEKTMTSPAQTTGQVTWGDPTTGERFKWRKTIS